MEAGRKSPELANLFDAFFADEDPHRVLEMGREVEELVNHPGWAVVEQLVGTLRSRALDQLIQGVRPLEAAEYAQKLGFLNGVGVSLDAAATVVERGERARRWLDKEAARQAAEV